MRDTSCEPNLYLSSMLFTFPYAVLGHVWYLLVSIPDNCCLPFLILIRIKDKAGTVKHVKPFISFVMTIPGWSCADQEGVGTGGPDPPEKIQKYWVS